MTQNDVPRPEWWKIKEVAELFRVSEDAVLRLLHAGTLRGRKIGGQWRIHRSALEEFAEPAMPNRTPRRSARRTVLPSEDEFADYRTRDGQAQSAAAKANGDKQDDGRQSQ